MLSENFQRWPYGLVLGFLSRPIWPSRDEFEVRWSHGLVEDQSVKKWLESRKK